MLEIHLSPHYEALSAKNPFGEAVTGPLFLEHQRLTAEAVPSHPLTVNTYGAGTGKTLAALLGWLAIGQARGSPLPNMLFIAPTNELIAQHVTTIQKFADQAGLDVHVIHVDSRTLRELDTPHAHERIGERLNRLIENPQEYGRVGRKPIAVVTNPDIFYYALYCSAYNRIDRRNLLERFILRFDYVVIDEFHYYSPKQLACFLFFFALCKEWEYFDNGRRVCLLSATPEPEIQIYLGRLFEFDEMAWISPAGPSPLGSGLKQTPALAPVTLRIISGTIDDFTASEAGQALLRQWLNEKRDGALISNALWRINAARAELRRAGFESSMARLTGAERTDRRRVAPFSQLLLATPTVDIGYNFEKPRKTRQPLDFIIYDARTRDAFWQRLARAGRVLGRVQTDVPSDAIALVDEETYRALMTLDGQTLTRMDFANAVQSAMRPRFDLYAYLRSYAVMEAFRPIFNLERMTRPDLHEWIERLFGLVRDIFAPDSRRNNYWSLRGWLSFYEKLERLVVRKEDTALPDVLEEYVRWHVDCIGQEVSDEYIGDIRRRLARDRRAQQRVREWAEGRYHLTEALYNFREAFQTPTAFVSDPHHLLSDSDTTLYDALHVAAYFKVDWFADRHAFEQAVEKHVGGADLCCHIRGWRPTRLTFSFYYREPTLPRERFEPLYTRRPVVLRGLRLQGHSPGHEGLFPLDEVLRKVVENQWVPLLIVRPQDEGRLRALLHGRDIILRYVDVSFAEGTTRYPAIVGTAAFIVHAELEGYLCYREKLEDNAPIFVGR
jgi:CRISPR-associated endonuclease/helicase Cas3